jgi:hypothetical protein
MEAEIDRHDEHGQLVDSTVATIPNRQNSESFDLIITNLASLPDFI